MQSLSRYYENSVKSATNRVHFLTRISPGLFHPIRVHINARDISGCGEVSTVHDELLYVRHFLEIIEYRIENLKCKKKKKKKKKKNR